MDEFTQMVIERGRFRRIEKRHYDTLTEAEFDKILKKIAKLSKKRIVSLLMIEMVHL